MLDDKAVIFYGFSAGYFYVIWTILLYILVLNVRIHALHREYIWTSPTDNRLPCVHLRSRIHHKWQKKLDGQESNLDFYCLGTVVMGRFPLSQHTWICCRKFIKSHRLIQISAISNTTLKLLKFVKPVKPVVLKETAHLNLFGKENCRGPPENRAIYFTILKKTDLRFCTTRISDYILWFLEHAYHYSNCPEQLLDSSIVLQFVSLWNPWFWSTGIVYWTASTPVQPPTWAQKLQWAMT